MIGRAGRATRLYPLPPQQIPADVIHEDIELPPPGHRDPARPYVVLNMVCSLDGNTAVWGRSGGIGGQTDRRTMRNLRSKVDAVMIGAGTLRAERLSLGIDDPSYRGPQPLAVILTGSGEVPLERNLLLAEDQGLLVLSPKNSPELRREGVDMLNVPADASGGVDLPRALCILKEDHAVDALLVEGGPTLNHALVSAGLIDEIFLTLAPKLLGGARRDTLNLLEGPTLPLETPPARLLCATLAGGELFLRYGLRPT